MSATDQADDREDRPESKRQRLTKHAHFIISRRTALFRVTYEALSRYRKHAISFSEMFHGNVRKSDWHMMPCKPRAQFRAVAACRYIGRSLRGIGIGFALCLGSGPVHAGTLEGLADFGRGSFAEAQAEWRVAAAAGDATASLYLGVAYDVGAGVPQNRGQAAFWYTRAADLGSAAAMFNLGVLYDLGQGAAQDPAQASHWYERAANHGYARAEYNLGLMYEGGSGLSRNRTLALHWFRRAAGHGIAAALVHLASLGDASLPVGRSQDEDLGLKAFQEAESALLSRKPEEIARAASLFRAAAARGNDPLAAYDLGYCYENALGVPLDLKEAYRWYGRAAAMARDDGLRSLASSSATMLAARLTPTELREARTSTR